MGSYQKLMRCANEYRNKKSRQSMKMYKSVDNNHYSQLQTSNGCIDTLSDPLKHFQDKQLIQRSLIHRLSLCNKNFNQTDKIKVCPSKPKKKASSISMQVGMITENQIRMTDDKVKKIYHKLQKFVNPKFRIKEAKPLSNGFQTFSKLRNYSLQLKKDVCNKSLLISRLGN